MNSKSPGRRLKRARLPLRAGFTLLEVILALAILAGGLAVLNEAVRIAQQCGRQARDLTYAQMLGEEKMNEISTGIAAVDSVSNMPFESPYDGWLYSVEMGDIDDLGLTPVTVTVTQDVPPETEPVIYSLVRWIGDPAGDASAAANANSSNAASQSTSSSNGSSSGSSGNTSNAGSTGGTTK